jgi:hypothetical protein
MKTLLIIYPHWPPSNLAGVHRPRLISKFIGEFGWQPLVLTVAPEFYEEAPDLDLTKTVGEEVEVVYTKAYKVPKPRFIGDIGIRAFPFLYKEALALIKSRNIDFIWVPIPSFYTSLLGRLLYEKTSIPYGIDYIDPWVRDIHNRKDLRSKLSLQIAKWLEPIAVKKASLISGVSEAYYKPVIVRNFKTSAVAHVGMPYGFDPGDHVIKLDNLKLPWAGINDCKPFVYAGAFLPNSHLFIYSLFKVIAEKLKQGLWDSNHHLFFIGTGHYSGSSISDYASSFGLSHIVHEIKERIPYLLVLNYLSSAYVVMAIGSTEPHYTASKIFQILLSNKPVFAIFHQQSTAVEVLIECLATNFLVEFNPSGSNEVMELKISEKLHLLTSETINWQPDFIKLNNYSAKASARALAEKLDELT